MSTVFDETNPWHVQADFIFMYYCETNGCDANIDFLHLTEPQHASLDFSETCVALADLAQSLGWTHVSGCCFLCPACSAARRTHGGAARTTTVSENEAGPAANSPPARESID